MKAVRRATRRRPRLASLVAAVLANVAVLALVAVPHEIAGQVVVAQTAALSDSEVVDPEAERVDRLERLVVEQIASALERPVAETRVALSGSVPTGVDSVAVAEGSGRWIVTFFVDDARVRRFARSGRVTTMPVAARPIARGTVLVADDVRSSVQVAWDDLEAAPSDVVGLVAQRAIGTGDALSPPTVRAPYLVRGGEAVQAVLVHSGVVMTLRGEALGSARKGDHVRVKLPSGVRVEGTVTGRGMVELNPGGRR